MSWRDIDEVYLTSGHTTHMSNQHFIQIEAISWYIIIWYALYGKRLCMYIFQHKKWYYVRITVNKVIIFADFWNETNSLNVCKCLGWHNNLSSNLIGSISNFILQNKTKLNITVQTIRQTEIKTNYINPILKKEIFLLVSQYDLLALLN